MILCRQSILARHFQKPLIKPFYENGRVHGMSYGLSEAGYGVRIDSPVTLHPGDSALAVTLEWMDVPDDILVAVTDKSTWARQFLSVYNTTAKPGWKGHLTLEVANHGSRTFEIRSGTPIAELQFHMLDRPTDRPYNGKYQDQPRYPVAAILEPAVDGRAAKTTARAASSEARGIGASASGRQE